MNEDPDAPRTPPPPPRAERILVVDDDDQVLTSLARGLDRAGFAVVAARNGREALARLAEQVPDLVLLDIEMPGMTGHGLMRSIRRTHEDLPIVVMSGTATGGH